MQYVLPRTLKVLASGSAHISGGQGGGVLAIVGTTLTLHHNTISYQHILISMLRPVAEVGEPAGLDDTDCAAMLRFVLSVAASKCTYTIKQLS